MRDGMGHHNSRDEDYDNWEKAEEERADANRVCPICTGTGRHFSEEAGDEGGEMVPCVTCRGSGSITAPSPIPMPGSGPCICRGAGEPHDQHGATR